MIISAIKININDQCEVKLTTDGAAYLKKTADVYYRHNFDPKTYIFKTGLWNIMNIFGNKLHVGCRPMFVGNDIIVREED